MTWLHPDSATTHVDRQSGLLRPGPSLCIRHLILGANRACRPRNAMPEATTQHPDTRVIPWSARLITSAHALPLPPRGHRGPAKGAWWSGRPEYSLGPHFWSVEIFSCMHHNTTRAQSEGAWKGLNERSRESRQFVYVKPSRNLRGIGRSFRALQALSEQRHGWTTSYGIYQALCQSIGRFVWLRREPPALPLPATHPPSPSGGKHVHP
jgi:hypothetical protein